MERIKRNRFLLDFEFSEEQRRKERAEMRTVGQEMAHNVSSDVAHSDSQLATLVDSRHYQARRHSIVHPTTIRLSPPSVVVDHNPGSNDSDSVRKPLTLPIDPDDLTPPNVSSTHDTASPKSGRVLPTTNDSAGGPALTAENVQPFCNKDTMIYALYPGLSGTCSLKLWKEMYRIWYPHRGTGAIGETGALRGGAFFAKFVMLERDCSAQATSDGNNCSVVGDDNKAEGRDGSRENEAAEEIMGVLARLVKFHEQLCEVVKGIVGTGKGLRMKGVNPRESPVAREQEEWYGLKKTFEDCFVLIEGEEWEREGVIVVWRGDRMSREMDELSGGDRAENSVHENVVTVTEDASQNQGLKGKQKNGEKWKCEKMGLEVAMMKIMFAQDPERKERKMDENAFWDKWYGRKRAKESGKNANGENE